MRMVGRRLSMSEQLYRKREFTDDDSSPTRDLTGDWFSIEYDVGGSRVLVAFEPVEPCEHGGYNKHISESMSVFSEEDYIEWCPGTGQKTNNDH